MLPYSRKQGGGHFSNFLLKMFNNTDKVTQMYLQLDLGCEKRGYKKNLNFISNEQFFLQNVARISSGPKCDSETNMLPAERWCPKDLLP